MWYFIDKKRLTTLLTDLSVVSDTTVRFFDQNGKLLLSVGAAEEFCRTVTGNTVLCAQCHACGCIYMHAPGEGRDKPFMYTCHLGISEVIVPAKPEKDVMGWVSISGAVPAQNREKRWDNILRLCREYGLDTQKVRESFFRLKRYDIAEGGMHPFARMIDVCLRYAVEERIICSRYPSVLEEAIETIKSRLHEPLSVTEVAETLGVSQAYLTNLMSKELGICPGQYIIREKMKIAADLLLQNGDMSIAQVGMAIGIADASYFSRLFKKHFGLTPSEYISSKGMQDYFEFRSDYKEYFK